MRKKKYVTIKPRGEAPFELRGTRMTQSKGEVAYPYSATRAEVRHVLKKRTQMFRGRAGVYGHVSRFFLIFHPSGAVSFGCCRFSAEAVKKLKRWAYAKRK